MRCEKCEFTLHMCQCPKKSVQQLTGEQPTMKTTQDPKYGINEDGVICNIATGVPIPSYEPVFILRAKDVFAEQTLAFYLTMTATEEHKEAIKHRMADFKEFRLNNPDVMKAPDTVYPFPGI